MKIGLSSTGNNLESRLDPRFGRTSNFIIYDLENDSYVCLDNTQNLNAAQGAGIQSAQNLINAGAEAIITGNVGPKAYQTLSAAGVEIFLSSAVTIKEAIESFKQGKLVKSNSNNVEGHWI